jgi:hypothetical protein
MFGFTDNDGGAEAPRGPASLTFDEVAVLVAALLGTFDELAVGILARLGRERRRRPGEKAKSRQSEQSFLH